jgi:hypothetical protein
MFLKALSSIWKILRRIWWVALFPLIDRVAEHRISGKIVDFLDSHARGAVGNALIALGTFVKYSSVDLVSVVCVLFLAAVALQPFLGARELSKGRRMEADRQEAITVSDRVLLHRVDFDYLPKESLFEHGWKMNPDAVAESPPIVESLPRSEIYKSGNISIKGVGNYGMDYEFAHVLVCDRVKYLARFESNGVVYLKFRIFPRDGSKARIVWLAQLPVGGTVPHRGGSIEWSVSDPTEILPSGWILFDLSLPDQMERTFRVREYQLLGIRIRGSLSISPIEFYGSRTPEKSPLPPPVRNPQVVTTRITAPGQNARVPWRQFVEGTVSDRKAIVWVIVHPMETMGWWVQPAISVKEDFSWRVEIYVGRPGNVDRGKCFEIRAVVDPKARLEEGMVLDALPKAECESQIVEIIRE